MELVGAAAGDEVDVAAEGAAELGLAAAGDDLHLADDVEAEGGLDEAGGVVVGGEAVDDEGVGEVALAVDGDALAGDGGGLGEELVGGGVGGGDARNEEREVEEVAAVVGEVRDFGLRDGGGDLAAVGFKDGRWASTLTVCAAPGLSVMGRSKAAPMVQVDGASDVREAGVVDRDFVFSDLEVGKAEATGGVGEGVRGDAGGEGSDRDGGVADEGAGGVGDAAGEGSGVDVFLGVERRRQKTRREEHGREKGEAKCDATKHDVFLGRAPAVAVRRGGASPAIVRKKGCRAGAEGLRQREGLPGGRACGGSARGRCGAGSQHGRARRQALEAA